VGEESVPAVEVRPIKAHSEFRQCERLQKAVWGSLSVSGEVMTVTQKYGGVILGAFAGGRLAGFLYAFLARRNGKTIHWSHMMAVAPDYRNQGLGFRMKLAHRKLALERGIRSICWTFDPLQSRNAALNIARLGALPEDYVADCYGHFPSKIEKGLPSDRFVINWPIGSSRVRERLRQKPLTHPIFGYAQVNETKTGSRDFLKNRRLHFKLTDKLLLVEIPSNTDEIRAKDVHLAREWRLETRRIFQRYLAAGYKVEDFITPDRLTNWRCFYVLKRANSPGAEHRAPETLGRLGRRPRLERNGVKR
jgi:predicted GNAT superfamily acetyltransferase